MVAKKDVFFWKIWSLSSLLYIAWRHALCDLVLSYDRNRRKFEHVIKSSMEKEMWSIYNGKYYEIWTFYS